MPQGKGTLTDVCFVKMLRLSGLSMSRQLILQRKKKLELSTYKLTLSNVLANAVEGKCHLTCYAKFLREYTDVKETVEQSDLALEIKNSASKGNVLFFLFLP